MQAHDDLEPTVRIRELKRDRVNFVLENVDLAYGSLYACQNRMCYSCHPGLQILFGES